MTRIRDIDMDVKEDKVFDYLSYEEDRLYQLYTEKKELIGNYIENADWEKVILEACTMKSIHNQLLLVSSMIEAHECGDI